MKRKLFEYARPFSVELVEQDIPDVPGKHEVYKRLVEDKNFPIGYQFDWEGIE